MKIKILISLLTLGISLNINAQTGSFVIHEQSFEKLFEFSSSKTIKNAGIPKNVPWVGSYWAYKRDGIAHHEIQGQYGESPAERFDDFWNLGSASYDWEKETHTCSHLTGDQKESCEGWWGHCNAWSGAAVKESEPKSEISLTSPINKKKYNFSVADQKALLTEAYMSVNSLFAGVSDKSTKTSTDWVFNPNNKKAQNWVSYDKTSYDAFWDVTPRAFFLIFTNYIGLNQMGVVIDRFTGDQVWNQPVVGYRILPIRAGDIKELNDNGDKLYQTLIRMKIYWAEDGVHEWEVSEQFSLEKKQTKNLEVAEEKFGHHYTGRLLQFYLYFSERPELSNNGTRISNSGRIVGDGLWYHQTPEAQEEMKQSFLAKYNISENHPEFDKYFSQMFNETHPDFIWLPTDLVASSGYGNPYVTNERVHFMMGKSSPPTPNDTNDRKTEEMTVSISNFYDLYPKALDYSDQDKLKNYVKRKIKAPLKRAGIPNTIKDKNLTVGTKIVEVKILFTQNGARVAEISNLLSEQGFTFTLE